MGYDALRAAHPDLAVSLYGLTPNGPVTLEVITPDGAVFTWVAATAREAIAAAFPPKPDDAPVPPENSIFD